MGFWEETRRFVGSAAASCSERVAWLVDVPFVATER
jgi:hypothetical protein